MFPKSLQILQTGVFITSHRVGPKMVRSAVATATGTFEPGAKNLIMMRIEEAEIYLSSLVCIQACLRSSSDLTNVFPQCGQSHWYGLSFLWHLM